MSVVFLIALAFSLTLMFRRLFGNKTKRMVAKLEQIMMTMEAAAKASNLEVLHYATRQQIKVLRWLHMEGEWPEERVMEFIEKRGLVRFPHDPAVHALLVEMVRKAEQRYGLVGLADQ